jgi:SPX domain protein involved in polyphosphate accumulation
MGKFEEQFYSSQIEDWKDYYLKYDVLKNLINNIYNEL